MNFDYQQLAIRQRNRHIGKRGEHWPNKPASALAMSRYPNILAELDAFTRWLDRIARYAMVSMEIMAEAMEDNGELSWQELDGLRQGLGCRLGYLGSPVLSMVNPNTNKGKARLHRLRELVRQTDGMERFSYSNFSKDVLPTLESGKPVTYAAYRWACKHLEDVLYWHSLETAQRRQIRTVRLEAMRPA